jgi:hypothetical protein
VVGSSALGTLGEGRARVEETRLLHLLHLLAVVEGDAVEVDAAVRVGRQEGKGTASSLVCVTVNAKPTKLTHQKCDRRHHRCPCRAWEEEWGACR